MNPSVIELLVLSVAGAIGCAARILVRDLLVGDGRPAWIIVLAINLSGAAAIGAAMSGAGSPHGVALMLCVGFLSGWTTFSAFAVDVVLLWRRGRRADAMWCWAATIIGAPLTAYGTWWVLQ
jgi:CrcB protein